MTRMYWMMSASKARPRALPRLLPPLRVPIPSPPRTCPSAKKEKVVQAWLDWLEEQGGEKKKP